jgi:hypothetical protein
MIIFDEILFVKKIIFMIKFNVNNEIKLMKTYKKEKMMLFKAFY